MFAKGFEDLEIWKMAREIVKDVYLDFSACRESVQKSVSKLEK